MQSCILQNVVARADVAELADALRSGRSEGDLVRVRISSSAPQNTMGYSITVVRLILAQVVEVRILVPQPIRPAAEFGCGFLYGIQRQIDACACINNIDLLAMCIVHASRSKTQFDKHPSVCV